MYQIQGVFRHHIILVLADEQADGRIVYVCLELMVDSGNIEAQLPQERRMESLWLSVAPSHSVQQGA